MRTRGAVALGLLWPACLLGPATAVAQAIENDGPIDRGALSEADRPDVEQLSGFIVDRTATNFGAEFFRQFSAAWRELRVPPGLDLTVVERPSARFGSQIFIERNNRPLVRLFLYAGRSATIKPLAEEAARYVGQQLSENALAGLLVQDPDLGRDELR